MTFDGDTFDSERDSDRLARQYRRVFDLMKGGFWWTLRDLEETTGYSSASISARIRDMRKERFGGHTVERRYVDHGEWEYRLLVAEEKAA